MSRKGGLRVPVVQARRPLSSETGTQGPGMAICAPAAAEVQIRDQLVTGMKSAAPRAFAMKQNLTAVGG